MLYQYYVTVIKWVATFRTELWWMSLIIRFPTALVTFILWYPGGLCLATLRAEFTFVLRTTSTHPTVCRSLLKHYFNNLAICV